MNPTAGQFPGPGALGYRCRLRMQERGNLGDPGQQPQGAFAPPCRLEADCGFAALAEEFELSGGAIGNVLRHAALAALRRGAGAIRREFLKYGRVTT